MFGRSSSRLPSARNRPLREALEPARRRVRLVAGDHLIRSRDQPIAVRGDWPFAAAVMDRFGARRTITLALAVTAASVVLTPAMSELATHSAVGCRLSAATDTPVMHMCLRICRACPAAIGSSFFQKRKRRGPALKTELGRRGGSRSDLWEILHWMICGVGGPWTLSDLDATGRLLRIQR